MRRSRLVVMRGFLLFFCSTGSNECVARDSFCLELWTIIGKRFDEP